jgi:hypothetical protein
MPRNTRLSQISIALSLFLAVLALTLSPVLSAVPNQSTTLGPEDESKEISVTVWLNVHNKAGLDALVQEMYDKNSPNYHHWLTMEEYKTRFAPTAKESAAVRDFLTAHNMKVSTIDQNNHFVVAQGRVGDAQRAFNVQINRVMFNGVVHRVNASKATVTGPAGALVAAVQGLSDLEYSTNVILASNPATGAPYAGVSSSGAGADGLFFSGQCLRPPQVVNFNTAGTFPTATYFGNRYGADNSNTADGTLPPCGYDPAELQTAYGLNPLYSQGLVGAGQTLARPQTGASPGTGKSKRASTLNGHTPLLPAPTSFWCWVPTAGFQASMLQTSLPSRMDLATCFPIVSGHRKLRSLTSILASSRLKTAFQSSPLLWAFPSTFPAEIPATISRSTTLLLASTPCP